MQKVAIFGSTGSVGRQALAVVDEHPQEFSVAVLAAGASVDALVEQARRYRPQHVVVGDTAALGALQDALAGSGILLHSGAQGLAECAALPDVDCVVAAITGIRGLPVSVSAVQAGKRLALANKESMVAAGPLLRAAAAKSGSEIIPVDSEHAAIFQCLMAGSREEVRRIILTASGGPFRTRRADTFASITVAEALRHPTWSMGPKISIDSATMMNKALEIVEARHLFDMEADKIAVVVHPQSVVHSMVEFQDGAVIAQMSAPDMRLPLQYAMSWPRRLQSSTPGFHVSIFQSLTFEEPDVQRFPSLLLGLDAARRGGTAGAVLNAANEVAVERFVRGEINFLSVFEHVGRVLARHQCVAADSVQTVLDADCWAREEMLRC
ncbi:MAG: 1-deoxy-D-xylulose-5-phosphate reductoisomerase [Planctomycetes bacterium]|nr:1-deoxy-D-xylulose-5-phosphate reductoisomerase [Planctomycetota bacterium]